MNSANLSNLDPLPRNALRHEVAVRLMSMIFQGTLPAGDHLIIRKMAEQMSVSATPVREALVELEAIGIVQFSHHKGVIVKPFGLKEFRDIFHLRRILETEAVRCACGQTPREELESLRNETRKLLQVGNRGLDWFYKATALDRKFHKLIAMHCDNPRLAGELGRYDGLMQAVREIAANRGHTPEKALQGHATIIDALMAGDAETAAAAMAQHVDATFQGVADVIFQKK